MGEICGHSCMNCMKKDNSLLSDLSYEELEKLEGNRNTVRHKKGEMIFTEGTKPLGLIVLNEGKVKIAKAVDDAEQIIALHKPVEFIGFRSLVSGEVYSSSAVALENSSICFIEKEDFMNVVNKNNQLSQKVVKMLVHQLEDADKRLVSLSHKGVQAKLADALLLIYDMYGTKDNGKSLDIVLKRSEIAAIANVTTANAIRTISAFVKEGVLALEGKEILIIDFARLRQIAAA